MSLTPSLGPRRLVPSRRVVAVSENGFTLIELLIVITIIAVLAGIAFPAYQGVQERARKVEAKNDVMQMVTAVNSYYTEYGVYPLNPDNNGGGSDTVYGDPNGTYWSADLFNVLRAIPDARYNSNNALNSKQVVFFNGHDAKDASTPKSGFSTNQNEITNPNGYKIRKGDYVDPWGDPYAVFIDADYDGGVTTALSWFYSTEYNATKPVRVGVAAASLGKNGKWGNNNAKATGTDDVLSWQ